MDDKGFPTEGLTKKYLAPAKGGVGGIITGFMGITAGQGSSREWSSWTMMQRSDC